ncbi:protein kinase domain-containing protein [Venturia nashicola]|uniref:Protein kinase domain-containing protein n=1 Tax=Venturia nashicola TaxID=86259 RepID=A0A4Z1PUW2_9PEZI|nr:protein kinase domain-containing protein [Venturia nashicola]TLD38978.1 protein kinase domain-containing protein [Venturia nashicola]
MLHRRKEIPVSRGEFISLGAVGWVHKINDHIALKSPRKDECAKFAYENEIYNIFGSHPPPCPDLSQSFLRVSAGNFLALYTGGTLEERLRGHQTRRTGPGGEILIKVVRKEPASLVERWIMELSNAAEWIESLGWCHTDIRPPNLLLDGHDHLKLTDFDSVQKIGTLAEGSAAPWARVLGPEAREECGSFGVNGARYEQFAIGSVLYLMTRGYEPYEDGNIDPEKVVDLLQQMKFPPLDEEKLDTIIERCWKGKFNTLKDLADETKLLPGALSLPRATALEEEYCSRIRGECKQLVENGILNEE